MFQFHLLTIDIAAVSLKEFFVLDFIIGNSKNCSKMNFVWARSGMNRTSIGPKLKFFYKSHQTKGFFAY